MDCKAGVCAPTLQIAVTDEEIVKALVAELVQVMNSDPFAAALKVRKALPRTVIACSYHWTCHTTASLVTESLSSDPLQVKERKCSHILYTLCRHQLVLP